MISRLLCGVVAVAMAGPCLGQEPPKAPRTASQDLVKQYSPPAVPKSPPPVVGFAPGSGFKNGYPNGSHCTTCGPGTQYLGCGCAVRLDLSNGIGLWDPCNHCYTCSSCNGGCW